MVHTLLILNLIPVLCFQLGIFGTWHLVSGATISSSVVEVTSKLKQYTGTLRMGIIVTPQCSLRLQTLQVLMLNSDFFAVIQFFLRSFSHYNLNAITVRLQGEQSTALK